MAKPQIVLIVFLLLAVLVGLIFFALGYFKPQEAAISVETNPISTVYLNGEPVGQTPYQTNIQPGEIDLKVVPIGTTDPLLNYETKINLNPGVKTIVRRIFGKTNSDSSGEIISFEKNTDGVASLSIISDPDVAQITVDGIVKGFTPIKISKITPGEHQLIIAVPNYVSKTFNINAVDGYKLTVISKLAESAKPTPVPVLSATSKEIKQVLISSTPTGYLNVRRDPSSASPAIGRVTPGLKYDLVNTDSKSGWYQIRYDGGKIGWVSNRYATVENPNNQTNP